VQGFISYPMGPYKKYSPTTLQVMKAEKISEKKKEDTILAMAAAEVMKARNESKTFHGKAKYGSECPTLE
jgi:hypothetical protein